jgi:HAMP domain-containing protein
LLPTRGQHLLDVVDLVGLGPYVDHGRVAVEVQIFLRGRVADQYRGIEFGCQGRRAQDPGDVEPLPADPDAHPWVNPGDAQAAGGGRAKHGDGLVGGGGVEIFLAPPGPSTVPPPGQPVRQGFLQILSAQAEKAVARQKSAVLHQLLINSGIALALMSVIAIVLGGIVAGRILRPLRTITTAARDISATSLHQRLALDGPGDELKELGDTFDGLLTRLTLSTAS